MSNHRRSTVRAALFLMSVCLAAAFLSGCFGTGSNTGGSRRKTLTTYYGESKVIAARYYLEYDRAEGSYTSEELSPDRIDDLVETLDSMEFKSHRFHSDYYWGGMMGIELDLEDGNHLTYDGTKIELRSESRVMDKNNSENDLKSDFLEITNCSFWDEVAPFFSTLDPTHVYVTSW